MKQPQNRYVWGESMAPPRIANDFAIRAYVSGAKRGRKAYISWAGQDSGGENNRVLW